MGIRLKSVFFGRIFRSFGRNRQNSPNFGRISGKSSERNTHCRIKINGFSNLDISGILVKFGKKINTLFPRFETPGTKYYLTHDKCI
jgi:hypothetical protein